MTDLTLMAVHAHPDDESLTTGGVLARYGSESVRTVLVTCTNGELGDAPGGVKPGEDGHDEEELVSLRRAELQASCKALGVSNLEMLGFHDSGMMGWPQNDAPDAFWNTPLDVAAGSLAAVMRRYRPQVVVTYDERGFYGHPDHIQAHRVTMAAAETTGVPDKVYYTAVPRSAISRLAEVMRDRGLDPPDPGEGAEEIGTPDELIGAYVDCGDYVDRKFESLASHASQAENIFFLSLGPELFSAAFATETFIRALDRTGAPLPEDDLFAGLR